MLVCKLQASVLPITVKVLLVYAILHLNSLKRVSLGLLYLCRGRAISQKPILTMT